MLLFLVLVVTHSYNSISRPFLCTLDIGTCKEEDQEDEAVSHVSSLVSMILSFLPDLLPTMLIQNITKRSITNLICETWSVVIGQLFNKQTNKQTNKQIELYSLSLSLGDS